VVVVAAAAAAVVVVVGVACSSESMGMVVGEVLRSSYMAIVCWMKEEL
jgi:hypothetical protein